MSDYKQDFLELIENLDEDEFNIKLNSEFSVKDVISNIISWEEEFAVCLMDSWQTGETPWFLKTEDYKEFNKISIIKYGKNNPLELIERLKFVIRVLDSEIDDIGIGRIKAKGESFEWVLDDSHYKERFNQIKKRIGIINISEINTENKKDIF